MSNTLAHHAQAAASFFHSTLTKPFSIYDAKSTKPTLVPYIGERIKHAKKWQQPREKREPYTYEMFKTFRNQIKHQELKDPASFMRCHSLVFDTQCLGLFTGSRVSEYAQSKGAKGKVSRVPPKPGQPPSECLPIAFVAQDFVFLSKNGTIIPHKQLFSDGSTAEQVQITFRHDKSGRNFAVRKFGRGRKWLCPIKASIRLLYRAHLLQLGPLDPICAYKCHDSKVKHRFLRDTEVTDTMRRIVVDTYPDPSHFLRIHIHRIASHCNRVTAAVALSQSNMTIDEIAHRLRWKPESVVFYLRESVVDIGKYTANAIAGAQREFT